MGKLVRTAVIFGFFALAVATSRAEGPVAWKFKTGGGVHATPIVHEGIVYIGSLDSVFYAIDARTGAERWRFRSPNRIFSTAALDGDIVCFESGNTLYGLDLQGGLKWQALLSSGSVVNQLDEWDYFHSSPLVVDGIAYIGSVKGNMTGIDLRTGSVVFHVQTPSQSTIKTRPAVFDGKIYFGDWDGVLHAYDARTGEKVWGYDTRKDKIYSWVNAIVTDPLVWNGAVYFAGRSCFLYSLNPETGARNWSYHDPADMWLLGGPTLCDSVLYIGSSLQNFIQAFDPVTGVKKWQQGVDYRVNVAPLVDGDCVFIGTEHITENLGSLYALDKFTGKPVNRLPVGGKVYSSPVLDGGIVYFGCEDGLVYALDKRKFLENPLPETGFKDKSKVSLGNIPADQTDFRTSVTLVNTGSGLDSVSVSLVAPSAMTTGGALNVEPGRFVLAPEDSQVIVIRMDASKIKPNKYNVSVSFTSTYNLERRTGTKPFVCTVTNVSGMENKMGGSPRSFCLEPNYPNPFNPRTTLFYSLPEASSVRFELYDMLGRKIRTLAEGARNPGRHVVEWDGSDDLGRPAGTGAYFCRLSMVSGGRSQTLIRKILLIK